MIPAWAEWLILGVLAVVCAVVGRLAYIANETYLWLMWVA